MSDSTDLAEIVNTNELVFNPRAMDQMMRLAEVMAGSKATIPNHLKNSVGDCFAVIMQAAQWKMNPFVVAQKTHVVNGTLGYEAQLVNAVVMASGAINPPFTYEYKGEGDRLECRVGAVPKGKSEMLWGEWLSISTITTKNSPLWKTNPKQQLGYLQVKNWARAYFPGAVLGVYTQDELEEIQTAPPEKVINPTQEDRIPSFDEVMAKIKTNPDDNFNWIDSKAYSKEEKAQFRAACTERRKELAEAAVVSTQAAAPTQKAEPTQKTEAETEMDSGQSMDWGSAIMEAGSTEDLKALEQTMPEVVKKQFAGALEEQYDFLRGL